MPNVIRQDVVDDFLENYQDITVGADSWALFIFEEAIYTFQNEADLATILTATTAIESHLRFRLECDEFTTFKHMIDICSFPTELKTKIHTLRKYRNKWAHKKDSIHVYDIDQDIYQIETDLENMSFFAIEVGFATLYYNNQSN